MTLLLKGLILFVIVITCCNNKDESKENKQQLNTNKKQEADTKKTVAPHIRALNDSAVVLMKRSYLFSEQDQQDSVIVEAIDLLDSAISLDPEYKLAYSNKFTAFRAISDDIGSIKTMKELLKINREPVTLYGLALVYEKMGEYDSSKKYFREAFQIYQTRMQNSTATTSDTANMYFVLMFLKGQEEMLRELNKQMKNAPNNETLLRTNDMFKDFDKEEFLNNW